MANEKRLIEYGAVYNYAFDGVHGGGLEDEDFSTIITAIDSVPTVDAVEVVRCKDCKHGRPPICTGYFGQYVSCNLTSYKMLMKSNDFCSYGERRTDG